MKSQLLWWEKHTDKKDLCVIIQNNQKIEGFLRLRNSRISFKNKIKQAFCVTEVCVHPTKRREGNGAALMKEATKIINKKPRRIAYLLCKQKYKDFYRACGWHPWAGMAYIKKSKMRPKNKAKNIVLMTCRPISVAKKPIILFGKIF